MKLIVKTKEAVRCSGSKLSMLRIVKSRAFRYKRCNDGRKHFIGMQQYCVC
jgi:hypothetical protein